MADIILLDTGIVFDFFSNKKSSSKTENLLFESRTALSTITVFELFNGVTNVKHIEQREQFVTLCSLIDFTDSIARKASEIYTKLKLSGDLIDTVDIIIAASAMQRKFPLFTTNKKHFERISGLILY
ncbi:MAG: type II toxin-antitoxin system VapC family toxin [Spirochaetes bacterium]|nr:type II toxin-antitoxin system VapC family toxin [Spirochaetota bacterium]MCK5568262.1 type II toxin-antitoxin system VapC family toxin [Spirochaetota bacterium]